ncbi:MAG: succinyldiaminopimelate transaminase [Gammaproteobacteria bacterium]|nr:succinyldiaminopimelate transaminase [Gammaproteobacteria bacterium]MDH5652812.1 succinyldiaminopimelate transaminase [Gammaproteobacteria bacterium]
MNPDLRKLQPYPFEKLAALKNGITPPAHLPHIALSIGEPKHAAPAFVSEIINQSGAGLSSYPLTRGSDELRQSIADWLMRRFQLPAASVDANRHVLPVNGTREALFSFAQAVIDRSNNPLILMPNPFYQIYEGAAFLSGAEPWFMNTTAETGFLADIDAVPEDVWQRCQLIYLCSPGNPTGAVAGVAQLGKLIELAHRHDFIIASDECYSEIYFDESTPPAGLLQASTAMGNKDFARCVVFHSLSKRSNLPGMRSGFVAGDANVLKSYLAYRTYHGSAMPPYHQLASIAAWNDEQHVEESRRLYVEKFNAVLDILSPVLDVNKPDAGFYLWPKTPIPGDQFAQGLFAQQNVTVLPGSYLSREAHGINPGQDRIRMALVAPLQECIHAAQRIRRFIEVL